MSAKPTVVKKEEAPKTDAPKTGAKVDAPVATGNIMDDLSKKQAFKKFSYRGEDIVKLLSLNIDEVAYVDILLLIYFI